jgi:hypothetical protein
VFQNDGSAAPVKKASVPAALKEAGFKTPAAKEAPKPKAPKQNPTSSQGGDLDPRAVALPGAWRSITKHHHVLQELQAWCTSQLISLHEHARSAVHHVCVVCMPRDCFELCSDHSCGTAC